MEWGSAPHSFDLVSLPFDELTADATRPTTMVEYMNKSEQWGEPIDVFRAPVDPFENGPDAGNDGSQRFQDLNP